MLLRNGYNSRDVHFVKNDFSSLVNWSLLQKERIDFLRSQFFPVRSNMFNVKETKQEFLYKTAEINLVYLLFFNDNV